MDHYSTGAIFQPNLGMNHNVLGFSLARTSGPKHYAINPSINPQNRVNLLMEIGPKEAGDNTFVHYTFSGFYTQPVFRFISLSVGANHFINYALLEAQRLDHVPAPSPHRSGVFGGAQLALGRSLFNTHIGWFLRNNDTFTKNLSAPHLPVFYYQKP